MKKIILGIFFGLSMVLMNTQLVVADTSTTADTDSVFGKIEAPAGVADLNDEAGETNNNIGLMIFISNIIKIASVVAGLWVMFNFISAGFTYITANGDSGAYAKIGEKLSLSATGLLLIVASYTIAGILGLLIFGDATYIINPQIPTAITTGT